MTIHIPVSSLDDKIKKLYLEDKLTGFGIDIGVNGYVHSKKWRLVLFPGTGRG